MSLQSFYLYACNIKVWEYSYWLNLSDESKLGWEWNTGSWSYFPNSVRVSRTLFSACVYICVVYVCSNVLGTCGMCVWRGPRLMLSISLHCLPPCSWRHNTSVKPKTYQITRQACMLALRIPQVYPLNIRIIGGQPQPPVFMWVLGI